MIAVKRIVIGMLGVLALLLIVVVAWSVRKTSSPIRVEVSAPGDASIADVLAEDPSAFVSGDATAGLSNDDRTPAISADLDAVSIGDLDDAFQVMDAELQGL